MALPQIRCQLHDHAKQYDNDGACHDKRNGGKLHGNISRNGYGNAIIGRYALQKKYTSVMIRVCHSRSRLLSCMYIHDKFMTESR